MAEEAPIPPSLFDRLSYEEKMAIIELMAKYNPRALQTGEIFNQLYVDRSGEQQYSGEVPVNTYVNNETGLGVISDLSEDLPQAYVRESLHNMFRDMQHYQGDESPEDDEWFGMPEEQVTEFLRRNSRDADEVWMASALSDLIGEGREDLYTSRVEQEKELSQIFPFRRENPDEHLELLKKIRQRQYESAAAGARNPRGKGLGPKVSKKETSEEEDSWMDSILNVMWPTKK